MPHFGTDGLRGRAGTELTAKTAYRIGRVLGSESKKKILVGTDTRLSSPMLSNAIVAGISASGSDAYCLGVVPTAMVAYLLHAHDDFDYGVMVSASHNPFHDNGIKILSRGGFKIDHDLEIKLEAYIEGEDDLPIGEGENIGSVYPSGRLHADFYSFLEGLVDVSGKGIKVLLDCANGSNSYEADKVFREWGCEVTKINDQPDGTNINRGCGSTYIDVLREHMLSGDYELGFAFDGDADRVLAVDRYGTIVDGDSQLIMAGIMLKNEGKLKDNAVVITPMSNLGAKKTLEKEGISTVEVGVGDRNIQLAMIKDGYSVGAEPSGHVIHWNLLPTGDGLVSASMVLKCFAYYPEIFAKAASFFRYPSVLCNIRFASMDDAETARNTPSFIEAIKEWEKEIASKGRIFIRASGTEPLLRIFVECEDRELAERCAQSLASTAEGGSK